MTIAEIKKKYGDHGGYIYCQCCPCYDKDAPYDKRCCGKIPTRCNGYDEAYEKIHEFLTEKPSVKPTTTSNVDHPSHYNSGKIECIDAMVESQGIEATKHFCICNAFKYIWRADKKNGLEDIDKAIWYLNKYKELCDGKEANL